MWIRCCFMCLNSACTCVCVCSHSLCVYPALQLAVWDPPCFQPGVHVHMHLYLYDCVRVCMRERNRQTGFSYGLHAVTEESRLWDMPGCQEHPPPTLYRLTALHSSVWMQLQSTVSSASSCHLETGPSAPSTAWYEIRQLLPTYFLAWFTTVAFSLNLTPDRLEWF